MIDENGFMLSTGFIPTCQRLLTIAAGCGAVALSAMTGLSPAMAEGQDAPQSSESISFYGETSQANQPGQGYIIFEQRGETLIGAFYYPQSEFSCFTGKKNGQTLEILSLPSHQDPMSTFDLALNQMQSIETIGDSERQTLSACRQDVVAFLQQPPTAKDLQNTQVANRLPRLRREAANSN